MGAGVGIVGVGVGIVGAAGFGIVGAAGVVDLIGVWITEEEGASDSFGTHSFWMRSEEKRVSVLNHHGGIGGKERKREKT